VCEVKETNNSTQKLDKREKEITTSVISRLGLVGGGGAVVMV
jgi:hypothetical protein